MRAVLCASFLVLPSVGAFAQEPPPSSPPRIELFVGAQAQTIPSDERFLSPAFGGGHLAVGVDWNVTPRVALVVTSPRLEVARYAARGTTVDYAILVGPRIRFAERGRWMPFASLLAGPAHGFVTIGPGEPLPLDVPPRLRDRYTALQVAVSGGVDLRLNDRYAIRIVEVSDRKAVNGPETDNAMAVASGVVVRFGQR